MIWQLNQKSLIFNLYFENEQGRVEALPFCSPQLLFSFHILIIQKAEIIKECCAAGWVEKYEKELAELS